ncbi:MAG TPA: hypothetical protein VGP44_03095, partial [Gemmatimonadales bacterium]|nr:hypothetical protein [Gemmatimonadales bacterium]
TRRVFSVGLVFALLAGVSCSAGDSPTGVSSQSIEQPAYLLDGVLGGDGLLGGVGGVVDGVVGTVLGVTDLLVCTSEPYEVATQTIGKDGGEIQIGNHTLVIPKDALQKKTTITAEQMPGRTNSLRFSPEGLRFEKSAELTMSYKNCLVVLLKKSIVYTDEKLNILEVLRSLDIFGKKTVTAPIDHFSRYAVAY